MKKNAGDGKKAVTLSQLSLNKVDHLPAIFLIRVYQADGIIGISAIS
jgi:hypothetical protein